VWVGDCSFLAWAPSQAVRVPVLCGEVNITGVLGSSQGYIMGSMGFLLADWSIELIKSKKRKSEAKCKKPKKDMKECSVETEGIIKLNSA